MSRECRVARQVQTKRRDKNRGSNFTERRLWSYTQVPLWRADTPPIHSVLGKTGTGKSLVSKLICYLRNLPHTIQTEADFGGDIKGRRESAIVDGLRREMSQFARFVPADAPRYFGVLEEPHSQIFVITHYPFFLNCFDIGEESEYLKVFVAERDTETGKTTFRYLNPKRLRRRLGKYPPGELFTRRVIDTHRGEMSS